MNFIAMHAIQCNACKELILFSIPLFFVELVKGAYEMEILLSLYILEMISNQKVLFAYFL